MNSLPSETKTKKAWSPTQIAWICMLFGAILATLLWALNNRRLKTVQPLTTHVYIWASVGVYLLLIVRLMIVEDGSAQFWRFRAVGLVLTLVMAWQLYVTQRGAFRRYRHEGGKTAPFWSPLLFGVVFGLLAFGVDYGVENAKAERDYGEFNRIADTSDKNNTPAINAKAEAFYLDFKRKYPEEALTYLNLARIYERQGRIADAKAELRVLLKLEPKNKEASDYLKALEEM